MTNREALKSMFDDMQNSDEKVPQEQWNTLLLTSIANSLAVIADAVTDGNDQFINKPCVSSGVCEHDKNVVLDKIRSKIDKIYERNGSSFDCLNALDELKEFIDKCRESEEDDGSIRN